VYHTDLKIHLSTLIKSLTGEGAGRHEFVMPFSAKRQNILVVGVDEGDNPENPFSNNRTDAMFIVSIAPYGRNVNVVSIPRDSKVYISGRSTPDKICHAFAYGGINLTTKTVEETFGVRIDHYIAISTAALAKFVDIIGGVPLYVENDLRYSDHSQNLHIDVRRGFQVLDGKQAEAYLRFRSDVLADIGRIRRQQWFMNALLERLKEPAVLIRVPEAVKAVPKYVQTDLSIYEITQFAALAKGLDSSNVQVATLPGSPSTRGEISYWILDPDKTQAVINRLIYRDRPAMNEQPLSAGILYTPGTENLAKDVRATLEQSGFTVNMQQRERLVCYDHIAIHNIDLPTETIPALKKIIPEIRSKQVVFDQVGFNRAGKDFTVVLAGSWE
jgi:LCP family protein required for cell wall assembly